MQAMQEESTRLAGEHKGGRVTSNFYLERTVVLLKKLGITTFGACTKSVLGAVCCFGVDHNVTFYSVSAGLTFVCLSRAKRLVDLLIEPMPLKRLSKTGDTPTFQPRLREEVRLKALARETLHLHGGVE